MPFSYGLCQSGTHHKVTSQEVKGFTQTGTLSINKVVKYNSSLFLLLNAMYSDGIETKYLGYIKRKKFNRSLGPDIKSRAKKSYSNISKDIIKI